MPLSSDPQKKAAQLANLQRGHGRPPSHGTRSPAVMVPLRAEAERWATVRWPWLDAARRHLVADLAARVERVRAWSEENDILIGRSGRTTRAHPVVVDADRWAQRLEALIGKYDDEARLRERSTTDSSALELELAGGAEALAAAEARLAEAKALEAGDAEVVGDEAT